ncbi:MAG TPA: flagellar hook-associated protein FlgL [Armatimonadetes bacterium]|jgi:flagellar hook-associated protein 3 FlgL|nr:flagellar hook-associated protein FlgL [Armatimonadota bacterium]
MRVSTRVMYGGLSDQLGLQASRLIDSQRRITTGQRLLRPSDDPTGAGRVAILDSRLSDLKQYEANSAAAKASLASAEAAIARVVESFRDARRLALAGANDTMGESERRLMAYQVDHLLTQVKQAAETRNGGRYIFSGTLTLTPPLDLTGNPADPYAYVGNDSQRMVEIADGVCITANVTARTIFNFDGTGAPSAPNAFAVLVKIRDDLNKGDAKELSNILDDVDALLENFNKHRAEIGQTIQRIEFNNQHILEQQEVVMGLRADVTEADFAEALVEYSTHQVVYQATIALASHMHQPGLFEFIAR